MGVSKFEPKVEGEGVDVSPHQHNLPGFLMIRDVDGLRHAIRFGSVQLVSDGDPCCDSTVVVVAVTGHARVICGTRGQLARDHSVSVC